MRIYCDGIFDVLHRGHFEHFKKIKLLFDNVHLVVGVISDKVSEGYKRKPIMNEKQRCAMVGSLLYVDEVFLTDMLSVTETFLNKHNIDCVVHAFSDVNDVEKQKEFFEEAIRLNKFKAIEYNEGVSTTKIINEHLSWSEIWQKKGDENIEDLYILNGWEGTTFNPQQLVEHMVSTLQVPQNSQTKVMEFGCGAGLLSCYLKEVEYYGLDLSLPLVMKNIRLLKNMVFHFSVTDHVFQKKYFDYVVMNSTLEYLASLQDVVLCVQEMERIACKAVYISNVRERTHTNKLEKHKYNGVHTHLTVPKQFFVDLNYTVTDSLYDKDRYDVYKIL
jgi:cytidyltransferase-like protein